MPCSAKSARCSVALDLGIVVGLAKRFHLWRVEATRDYCCYESVCGGGGRGMEVGGGGSGSSGGVD